MVSYTSLSGCMTLQVVGKFRTVHDTTRPGTYERTQAGLPLIAELEEDLDQLAYSVAINGMLMLARVVNVDTPSAERFRRLYADFKNSLHTNPKFMNQVINQLPDIVARYSTNDIMYLLSDRDFLALLTKKYTIVSSVD